jgi:hypothetical protein
VEAQAVQKSNTFVSVPRQKYRLLKSLPIFEKLISGSVPLAARDDANETRFSPPTLRVQVFTERRKACREQAPREARRASNGRNAERRSSER